MNEKRHAVFHSSFIVAHSSFILLILSILVNSSVSEGDAHRLHYLAQDFFRFFAAAVERRGESRVDDEAVREDGEDETLHVVGQTIVAPFRERERLRRAEECERAARAYAEV